MDDFKNDTTLGELKDLGIETAPLVEAIDGFVNSTIDWQKKLDEVLGSDQPDPLMAKYFNDQMIKLDRAFLLSKGLPGMPQWR